MCDGQEYAAATFEALVGLLRNQPIMMGTTNLLPWVERVINYKDAETFCEELLRIGLAVDLRRADIKKKEVGDG